MGRVGHGLFKIRLESERRTGNPRNVLCVAHERPGRRIQPVQFHTVHECRSVIEVRQLLANYRRHPGKLGFDEQEGFWPGKMGKACAAGPLERSRYASGRPGGLGTTASIESDAR